MYVLNVSLKNVHEITFSLVITFSDDLHNDEILNVSCF